MVKEVGRHRLIPVPKIYDNLSQEQILENLQHDLTSVITEINNDRLIQEISTPSGIAGTFGASVASIYWDDVNDDLRMFLDGARIWRCGPDESEEIEFSANDDKTILVNCMRTTRFNDVGLAAGDYIYWVQWINLDGKVSNAAGGVSGTVT
jgi:hypothetical protein